MCVFPFAVKSSMGRVCFLCSRAVLQVLTTHDAFQHSLVEQAGPSVFLGLGGPCIARSGEDHLAEENKLMSGSFWTKWKPKWSNKSQKMSPAFCMAHRTSFWDYNLMFAKDKPSGLEEGFHTHWGDLVLLNVYALESRYLQVLALIDFAFLWKSCLWFHVFDSLGVNIS